MFRFTIRDLLWLTLVVGMGTCLWLSLSREAKLRDDSVRLDWKARVLAAEIKGLGGAVSDDGQNITLTTALHAQKVTPIGTEVWKPDGSYIKLDGYRTIDGKPCPPYSFPK
jgi:hypothetical protein